MGSETFGLIFPMIFSPKQSCLNYEICFYQSDFQMELYFHFQALINCMKYILHTSFRIKTKNKCEQMQILLYLLKNLSTHVHQLGNIKTYEPIGAILIQITTWTIPSKHLHYKEEGRIKYQNTVPQVLMPLQQQLSLA